MSQTLPLFRRAAWLSNGSTWYYDPEQPLPWRAEGRLERQAYPVPHRGRTFTPADVREIERVLAAVEAAR
jgi:hypothetical protein